MKKIGIFKKNKANFINKIYIVYQKKYFFAIYNLMVIV